MQRTINISDKYKSLIKDYENKYDKKEFDVLFTNLLKLNKDLKNQDLDIFVIGDLLLKSNIDSFTLIMAIANIKNGNAFVPPTPAITQQPKQNKKETVWDNTVEKEKEKQKEKQNIDPILSFGGDLSK